MATMEANQHAHQSQLRMFIVDVLRHDDIEQVLSIINLLNNRGCIGWRAFWPHDFTREEVVACLVDLAAIGFVRVLQELPDRDDFVEVPCAKFDTAGVNDRTWFRLTENGRKAWDQWEPPKDIPHG